MVGLTVWHNPRCSKSRAVLALLEKKHLHPQIVLYLETPPSAHEIRNAVKTLGISPRDLIRKKEPVYTRLQLRAPHLKDNDLIAAMAKHPILIERPVIFFKNRAVIGRPPEAIFQIL